MPRISGYVIEKWSKILVPNVEIRINGVLVTKSDDEGRFIFDVGAGTYELKASKVMYEDSKQNITFIGDSSLNIIIKPVMTAL